MAVKEVLKLGNQLLRKNSELLQHEIDHLDGILATDYLQDNRDIVMRSEWERCSE